MIKLVPILNEIKTIGNITPKMVMSLWDTVDMNLEKDWNNLKLMNDWSLSPYNEIYTFIVNSSPTKLREYYVELFNIAKSNNLNEIKTAITADDIMKYWEKIYLNYDLRGNLGGFIDIFKKYGYRRGLEGLIGHLNKLDSPTLFKIYKEMQELENRK